MLERRGVLTLGARGSAGVRVMAMQFNAEMNNEEGVSGSKTVNLLLG